MQSSKSLAIDNILRRTKNRQKNADQTQASVIAGSAVATTTGYEAISPDLCRVRVEIRNSDTTKEALLASVKAALGNNIQPVQGSFSCINYDANGMHQTREYVGLVAKGIETRTVEKAELGQRYATMAANVLMDSTDDSVWNMATSPTGHMVLSRQVDENLSELIEMARKRNTANRNYKDPLVAIANVASYAHFYNSQTKTLDFGYVCGREADGSVVIASRAFNDLVSVDERELISASNIHRDDLEYNIHKSLHTNGIKCPAHLIRGMRAQRDKANAGLFSGGRDKVEALVTNTETPLDPFSVSYTDMREYYRQMYAYAPEYFAEFEKLITESGF